LALGAGHSGARGAGRRSAPPCAPAHPVQVQSCLRLPARRPPFGVCCRTASRDGAGACTGSVPEAVGRLDAGVGHASHGAPPVQAEGLLARGASRLRRPGLSAARRVGGHGRHAARRGVAQPGRSLAPLGAGGTARLRRAAARAFKLGRAQPGKVIQVGIGRPGPAVPAGRAGFV
jgi:hypothetical protein